MRCLLLLFAQFLLHSLTGYAQMFTPGNGVTDIDGNNYETLVIGNFEWMAENLRVSKFANGDQIPNLTSDSDWNNALGDPACCSYDNQTSNDDPYGKLYNWYVVDDNRGVCPSGWRVPDYIEWSNLLSVVDPDADPNDFQLSNSAGFVLKDPSFGFATNESGFTALPAGRRTIQGTFMELDQSTAFWPRGIHTFEQFQGSPTTRVLIRSSNFFRSAKDERNGCSIRCVKNPGGTHVMESENKPFNILHNPVNNRLELRTEHMRFTVSIFSSAGAKLLTSTESSIKIDELADGMYFLEFKTDSGSFTDQFIKSSK